MGFVSPKEEWSFGAKSNQKRKSNEQNSIFRGGSMTPTLLSLSLMITTAPPLHGGDAG
jgi:hypothetical protein